MNYPKYLEKDDVYNRLTVIDVAESSKVKDGKKTPPSQWKYRCVCICGVIKSIRKDNLCTGITKSCGCFQREEISKRQHKVNLIEITGNITKVFFFNTNKYTMIDSEDYDRIKNYCWRESTDGRSVARLSSEITVTLMHRMIMNYPLKKLIDHIDRNPLNNRKSNLRICTHAENERNSLSSKNNTSGYKGVGKYKACNKWQANIGINNKTLYLGSFENKQDAIDARYKAEIKYFGEFAPNICRSVI